MGDEPGRGREGGGESTRAPNGGSERLGRERASTEQGWGGGQASMGLARGWVMPCQGTRPPPNHSRPVCPRTSIHTPAERGCPTTDTMVDRTRRTLPYSGPAHIGPEEMWERDGVERTGYRDKVLPQPSSFQHHHLSNRVGRLSDMAHVPLRQLGIYGIMSKLRGHIFCSLR